MGQTYYEAVLEHVTDLVAVLDAGGLFRYASPSYQRLLGYSPAQLLGTSAFALVHPEDVAFVQEAFVHALQADGAQLTVTCRWRQADGSWRLIESRGSNRLTDPLVRGLVVTGRDIADHDRASVAVAEQVRARDHVAQQATTELAAQLAYERALLAAVVQQMPRGVIIAEAPSGRLILANARAEQIWRHPFREGANIAEYRQGQGFHPDGRPYRLEEWPLARAITAGETVMDEEMTIRRGDGTQGMILVSAAPLRDARGTIVAGVVTFHDITTLKDLEHAREEFLSSAVHDLKAPLTTVRGYTQLAQRYLAGLDASDAAAALKHLARIDESARRMVSVIHDMEDTTRAQMGVVLDLDRRPTDVVALVRRVVEHQQAMTAHQIHVEAAVPTLEGPLDADRVERVVANLLSNAVKYSPDGGHITVQVAREDEAAGPQAMIAVRDEGIGIPAADVPFIFERFHRAGNTAGRIKGTGIGLASVRHIVEQHGGTVSVESQEGAGSTFTVRLPLPAV